MITYAQNFEDVLLERCFSKIDDGFFIDVGAGHPIKDNLTYHFYKKGWRGINIEPQTHLYELLQKMRPNDININVGVYDIQGQIEFYRVMGRWEFSTFDANVAEFHKKEGHLVKSEWARVETLNSILGSVSIPKIHFLKIDVEGSEEKVLRSIDLRCYHPRIILIEATYPTSSKENYFSWEPYLLQNGYTFLHFDGLNRFYTLKDDYEFAENFTKKISVFDDVQITIDHPMAEMLKHDSSESSSLMLAASRLGYSKSVFKTRNVVTDELIQRRRDKELAMILDDFPVNQGGIPLEIINAWQAVKNEDFSQIIDLVTFPIDYVLEEAPFNIPVTKLYHKYYAEDELADEGFWIGKVRVLRLFLSKLSESETAKCIQAITDHWKSYRPLLVLQAEMDLIHGRYEHARKKLSLALGFYYDDIYAQKLFLHSTDHPIPTLAAKNKFCNKPFIDFEVQQGGEVTLCCKPWLPASVGNIFKQSWNEIWNSRKAQLIRKSILDGTYKYCSPISCPLVHYLPDRDYAALNSEFAKNIVSKIPIVDTPPVRCALSYDRSCNIQCKQCRNRLIVAKGAWKQRLEGLKKEFTLPFLKNVCMAYITGSGDAIGSVHFFSVLKDLNRIEYPKLKLHLSTNGQLLTQAVWDKLKNLDGMIDILTISIDGIKKETYEKLRCGASFEKLIDNMEIISKMRKRGSFERLDVNMVVQKENYNEMIPLIKQCKQWSVDKILFYRLRQWGTYSPEEYMERDIFNPLHPQHANFLELLEDDIFHDPIVLMWDLAPFVNAKKSSASQIKSHNDFFKKK